MRYTRFCKGVSGKRAGRVASLLAFMGMSRASPFDTRLEMFGTYKRNQQQVAAFELIEAWTRARFRLAPGDAVLVTELTCRLPGCPPLETVIAFWNSDGTRHHVKVFKKAVDVVEGDLPPSWYRPALAVDDNASMDCGC